MNKCCCGFDFTFDEQELDFSIGMCYTIVHGDEYMGEYEITPKVIAQFLPTQDKTLTRNVTVFEIPYNEVSNQYGTTVSIGTL